MHVAAELKVIGIRQGRKSDSKFIFIGSSQWMSSCQTCEEEML